MRASFLLRCVTTSSVVNGQKSASSKLLFKRAVLLTDLSRKLNYRLLYLENSLKDLQRNFLRKILPPEVSPKAKRLVSLGRQNMRTLSCLAKISIVGRVMQINEGFCSWNNEHPYNVVPGEDSVKATRISVRTSLTNEGEDIRQVSEKHDFTIFCTGCFSLYANENLFKGDVLYATGDVFYNSPTCRNENLLRGSMLMPNIIVGYPLGTILKLGRIS